MENTFAVVATLFTLFLAFVGLFSLTLVWFWLFRFKIKIFVDEYIRRGMGGDNIEQTK